MGLLLHVVLDRGGGSADVCKLAVGSAGMCQEPSTTNVVFRQLLEERLFDNRLDPIIGAVCAYEREVATGFAAKITSADDFSLDLVKKN